MSKYKTIFFDLDHTIWDFETNAKLALQDLYTADLEARTNAAFNDFFDRYSFHNTELWGQYEKGLIPVEDLKWKRMSRTLLDFKIGDEVLSREMSKQFLEILPTKKAIFPYTFEILDYLKNKNYGLHLITNGFIDVQTKKLAHSGLDKYFDEMITSERSDSLKPKPEIFEYAMKATNTTANESIMIGDNQHADIAGALNVGMDAIFVNHINEPIKIKPSFMITHLKEIESIL